MKIHAHAAQKQGADLTPWTYDVDEVTGQDCVIEVKACGLCRSDLHMIDNDWMQSDYPLVPGHEVVGEVVELGDSVEHLSIGQRVGVGWQQSACLHCRDCLRGDENLCAENESLIGDGYGGFADYVRCDSPFVFPLPDGIDTLKAGPLLCGGVTVYSALRHAGMSSGGHVGVIGIGGLGHLAVQFASKLGNKVTAFTSSEDKADFATQMGADEVVVSEGRAPSGGPEGQLDILLNTAPVNFDWAAYMQLLDTDGTLSIVAAPGEPMEVPAQALMFQRRRIMGSVIGGRAIMREMLEIADDYDIEPVTEVFPMSQVNKAITKLREGNVRYRAVLQA